MNIIDQKQHSGSQFVLVRSETKYAHFLHQTTNDEQKAVGRHFVAIL